MCDALCVSRILLWVVFAVLVVLDLMFLPLALFLFMVGTTVGHPALGLLTIFSVVLGAVLIWPTVIVGKALRTPSASGPPTAGQQS
jgi:hypothetical protein